MRYFHLKPVWPFLSDLRHFHPQNYFLYFVNPREGCVCDKSSRQTASEVLRPACLTPTTMPCSKSLKLPFFPMLSLSLIILFSGTGIIRHSICVALWMLITCLLHKHFGLGSEEGEDCLGMFMTLLMTAITIMNELKNPHGILWPMRIGYIRLSLSAEHLGAQPFCSSF